MTAFTESEIEIFSLDEIKQLCFSGGAKNIEASNNPFNVKMKVYQGTSRRTM